MFVLGLQSMWQILVSQNVSGIHLLPIQINSVIIAQNIIRIVVVVVIVAVVIAATIINGFFHITFKI
jgi:hypothetical protein